jgi:hypothetical protein
MSHLFISYARTDDEPFAKRLCEDLTAHGIQVWRDREAMESRGRTFLQEIRDAIASADRLLLVIGPKAVQSDYVRVEWDQALNECSVITPILCLGDYSLTPPEISKLHCVDMRETRPMAEAPNVSGLTSSSCCYSRATIESITDQSKNILQIEHTRHSYYLSFCANCICKLIAHYHLPEKLSLSLDFRQFLVTWYPSLMS